jgi:hypothetical protein
MIKSFSARVSNEIKYIYTALSVSKQNGQKMERILLITIIAFYTITGATAINGQQVDACDLYGFPLRYYVGCANEGGLPVSSGQGFSWLYYLIDILCVLIPVAFIFSIGTYLKKLKH